MGLWQAQELGQELAQSAAAAQGVHLRTTEVEGEARAANNRLQLAQYELLELKDQLKRGLIEPGAQFEEYEQKKQLQWDKVALSDQVCSFLVLVSCLLTSIMIRWLLKQQEERKQQGSMPMSRWP